MARYLKKSYHIFISMKIPSEIYLVANELINNWQLSPLILVIVTAKTSRTRSHVSVVVCQILRSASSIWEERGLLLKSSPCAFISCQMNMNSWAQKLWKLVAFAATNTWSSSAVKISSTSEWDCIHSMLSASTKCCPVPELIGKKHEIILRTLLIFFNDELLEHWAMNSTMIKTNPLSRWLLTD